MEAVTQASDGELWEAVDRLLDRAPNVDALQAHGLVPLGIRRWRVRGRAFPESLVAWERGVALATLTAPAVLARARVAYDGRMMLFKGPLLASRYPASARSYTDLDLLVDDAQEAQRALIAAGFVEMDEPELFVDIHHLRPLGHPSFPLQVELHSHPKWPEGMTPPSAEEIFEAAHDGAAGVDGVLAPAPLHHTMLLTAHGWGHGPLRSLRDLVDVAAMAHGLEAVELSRLASRWDIQRPWRLTAQAIDNLFQGRATRPLAMRVWARHLAAARERTVFESHLEHWLSPFWSFPFRRAATASWATIAHELRPAGNESWRDKGKRTVQALARSFTARSTHERKLGELATRGDLRRIIQERRRDEQIRRTAGH